MNFTAKSLIVEAVPTSIFQKVHEKDLKGMNLDGMDHIHKLDSLITSEARFPLL